MKAELRCLTLETVEATLLKLFMITDEPVGVKGLAEFEEMVDDAGEFVSGSGNGLGGAVFSTFEAIEITEGTVGVS